MDALAFPEVSERRTRARWIAALRSRWAWYLLRGVIVIAVLAGAVVMLTPLAWLVSTSLKPDDQLFAYPPVWIPRYLNWANYANAWNYAPFGLYLTNTLIITSLCLVGTLASSSLVAYGFARGQFPGRDVLFAILLSTMMLPSIVTLIPLFLVFKALNWINTFLPLIVPSYFASPFYVFLLRQFFMSLPRELDDAAYVDGASTAQVLVRVILPLAKPALASVTIFSVTFHWNDFLAPLIYLNDQSMYTLALGLYSFLDQHTAQWGYLMAASTLMVVPMVGLFFFAQKYFIQGIVTSGFGGR